MYAHTHITYTHAMSSRYMLCFYVYIAFDDSSLTHIIVDYIIFYRPRRTRRAQLRHPDPQTPCRPVPHTESPRTEIPRVRVPASRLGDTPVGLSHLLAQDAPNVQRTLWGVHIHSGIWIFEFGVDVKQTAVNIGLRSINNARHRCSTLNLHFNNWLDQ